MVKNLPASAGDVDLVPELGRSPREGNGYPLQYSCLGNTENRRAWWAPLHGEAEQLETTKQQQQGSRGKEAIKEMD